ncbi:Nonribosomal Peptide Synthase (NRPS) [Taiwanofungus camphoratus]|nr:Nonribosomal Peptide Synthase (NRPS) [Antrodia cinnamomea]KAI0945999.1 Nonribosomal Peptide Synthase (NRPS) [Antrodia cinnamomea]
MFTRFGIESFNDYPGFPRGTDDIFFDPLVRIEKDYDISAFDSIEATLPISPLQACLIAKHGDTVTEWTSKQIVFSGKNLDTVRVQAAWDAVAAHNPILRTAIQRDVTTGQYVQAVLQLSRPLRVRHTNGGEATDLPSLLLDLAEQIPYAILRYDSRTDCYILNVHYLRILFDDFSFALIEDDLLRFYRGASFGERVPLRAYLAHIQEHDDREKSLAHWRATFGNVSSPLLPYTTAQTDRKAKRKVLFLECDEAVKRGLDSLSSAEAVPCAAILEALWAIVLSRHCATDSVVFAVSTRDVSFPDAKKVVGYMCQLFPLRAEVEARQTVLDLARALTRSKQHSSQHANLSYDEIVAQLPQGSKVQTLVRFVDDVERATCFTHGQRFPIELYVKDSGSLKVSVWFDAYMGYDKVTLTVQHFFALLEQYVRNPVAAIGDLDCITNEEKSFILSHSRPAKLPTYSLVHRLFEEQVTISPDAIAVQYERSLQITFYDLNKFANLIAHSLPYETPSIIPVCMDVSVEFIAVLLAIMKSGNAYVILDPENAAERNSFIVRDVDARHVLCHQQYAARFGDIAQVIQPFVSGMYLSADRTINLERTICIDQPAYLVYTSGSTGKPKGVILSHAAATCGISNFRGLQELRSLLFYNPIFSAAQRTILATLIHGGCLCLANRKTMSSSLARIINEMGVTAVGLTSSTAALLTPDKVPGLRQLTLTGEMLDPRVVELWSSHVQVRNAYGLSECTQINMGRQLLAGSNPRIVGRPSDTTSAYILIPGTTNLAPLLVQGELCLGGHQLAQGYLNLPAVTEKAFILNPFGSGRLYRTGDLAVRHEDGSIEILGRIDHQVKINGQRVEPAEVAAVLATQREVSAAAVVGATIAGRKCLVACFVPEASISQDGIPAFVERMKNHASDYLPLYMVPNYYLPLAALPRNANGKLDVPSLRRTVEDLGREGLLAAISGSDVGSEEATTVSPHMAVLKQTVAEVLAIPIEAVTSTHSFLLLGGSSLEAIRVSGKALEKGLHVEAGDLIRADSFEKLLHSVKVKEWKSDPEPFSLLKEVPSFPENVGAVSDAFPVTPMQEGLLATLLRGDTKYIYQRAYNVGGLDLQRLKGAVQTVFEQRPLLRTTFIEWRDSFLNVIQQDLQLPWEEYDMELADFETIDRKRSMQLGSAFFRVAILSGQVLVVSMHHALFDYWSHRLFYEDVASVYLGSPQLSPRPPFSRFVAELVHAKGETSKQFWSHYLDNLHPSVLGGDGEFHFISRRIKVDFASARVKHGFTPGSIVYAAWALVVSRQINSDDVVFASTLSGRDRPVIDIEHLDGPTLTTVPQRVRVNSNLLLVDLVTAVQEKLWDISEHGQYGMRDIMRASRQGSVKLFDTMVNYLTPAVNHSAVGQIFKPHGPKKVWTSEYQTLEVQLDAGEDLSVTFISGMDTHRADFILEEFVNALKCIVSNPRITVGEVELISEREQDFVSHICLQTSFPPPAFLHAQFERIAQTTPDRLAIQWLDQGSMTYDDLNKRANRFAHFLRRFIEPGDIVALMLDKSPLMIVSILGVMKAGGAYVPLSPDNPAERNNFIIDDVSSKVLITESHQQFVVTGSAAVIEIDVLDIALFPSTTPEVPHHSPSHPAYVIYTSGSTGKPKGVVMPHSSAAAAVSSMVIAERRFEGEWRVLQFANYVFDASVEDIFNTLSSGGCLCMAPMAMMLSDLPGVMTQMRVRQAILTPTVARLITPEQVPTLNRLILGGEPMTSELISDWTKRTTLLNVYGPTETAMVITTKELSAGDDPKNIGRPFPTASAFILDVNGTRLVPYGAVGELCFGGSQLSAGYLHHSDLTSAVYVDFDGQRVYRTGDLARWLPSGELECLGRKDNQIKINGHRIELQEIENAIIRTGEVTDSVVLGVVTGGKPQLVAMCIFKPGETEEFLNSGSFDEAFTAVKEKLTTLTPYMIPKFWIAMECFPKLPSRKTNRKALAEMVGKLEPAELSRFCPGSSSDESVVPVETPEEEVLQRLWANQFSLEPQALGRNSNFMSLGADSISAIKLVGQCRREGYKLEVSQVLDNLTLSAMAACMTKMDTDSLAGKAFVVSAPAYDLIESKGVNRENIEDILPCPPGQVEFLRQGQRDEQFWNLMTVRSLPSEVDLDRWLQVTTTLTQRNSILRTTFIETPEHGWLQVVLKDSALVWEALHVTREEREHVVESAWSERFEFGKPFICYKLFVYPDNSRELLVKLDHALYDGQLLRVFDDQFQSITRGEDPPATSTTFKDFALSIWQTPKDSALSFWFDLLSGSNFVFPKTETPKITASKVRRTSAKLDSLAQTFAVTTPIVFQTAFQLWLFKVTDKQDVVFDLLVTGRNVNGLEDADRINGTCANFLPFRSRLAVDQRIGDYLKATQSLFWRTNENAVVGLDDIFAHLHVDRRARASRVLFLYQPFEPAKGPVNHHRWLVMAMSQVRLYQPYAIVVEVSKTLEGHSVKFFYDETAFTAQEAESSAADIVAILDDMVKRPDAQIGQLLQS